MCLGVCCWSGPCPSAGSAPRIESYVPPLHKHPGSSHTIQGARLFTPAFTSIGVGLFSFAWSMNFRALSGISFTISNKCLLCAPNLSSRRCGSQDYSPPRKSKALDLGPDANPFRLLARLSDRLEQSQMKWIILGTSNEFISKENKEALCEQRLGIL